MENPVLQIVACIFITICVLCLVLYIVVLLTINCYATEPVMLQAPPNMVSLLHSYHSWYKFRNLHSRLIVKIHSYLTCT